MTTLNELLLKDEKFRTLVLQTLDLSVIIKCCIKQNELDMFTKIIRSMTEYDNVLRKAMKYKRYK